ncbi:MAG: peptide chain release factor N(5)-glutamine methyltransferase [Pseudomonadales bacterium]|nr:peptide chain release factor N(5)-glutamine methyltransferase [Pseudomonadales bacterium]
MATGITVKDILGRATRTLDSKSPTARLDAELLLCHVMGKNRTWLKTWDDKAIDEQQVACFDALIARRSEGEPVAYIVEAQEFWSLPLTVTSATLIPRPETELLIDILVARFDAKSIQTAVDLGTGSGAIALAIAQEFPLWRVSACDISLDALAVAQKNRQALNLSVEFKQSNWFSAYPHRAFDVVVANPPYIESGDPHLNEGDVRFEPRSALASGVDGLDDIHNIIRNSHEHLNPNGLLLFEHGYNQGPASRQLLTQYGFENIETFKDLAGHDRVTLGYKA